MRLDRIGRTARLALPLFALAALRPAGATAQADNVALVQKLLLDQRMVVVRGSQNLAGTLGQRLASGDLVNTSNNTRAAIRFTDDGSIVRLNPNARLVVRTDGERGNVQKTLDLEFGELWAKVSPQQRERGFQVQTPSGVAAVKGTEFIVRVDENGNTTVLTFEGAVDFFNNAGLVTVEKDKKVTANGNNAQPALADVTDADKKATEVLAEKTTDDNVIRIEIPIQNAAGVAKTLVLEVPRKQAEAIVNPGGGQ